MQFPILTSLVALPIVGAIAAAIRQRRGAPRDAGPERSRWSSRCWCLPKHCCSGAASTPASADFQFVERHAWIPAFGISYFVGVDGISLLLLVLTGFLTPLALLSSWESVHKKTRAFCIFVLLLESAMIGVFVSLDLFLFYVFWDAMLIPMYFLIGIWGYDRRIYAAVKFILYTMAGSVLMLLAILALAYLHRSATGAYSFDLAEALRALDSAALPVLVLSGVRAGVCHQGAAVSVSHLAAGRARRGADRRLGDSGGRAAEDGHVRVRSVRVSAVSAGRGRFRAVPRVLWRSSASSTARSWRWCSPT